MITNRDFYGLPMSGDWVLALHQKSHDGYRLDCKQARVVTRNMQACLNHPRPPADADADFVKDQYAGVYKSFYDFASRYYGIDNLVAGIHVNPAAYTALNPIHVFDVSKQVCRSHCKDGI